MSKELYREFLGVPDEPWPPDHYTLLGLECFCGDPEQVEDATRRQLDRLDQFALHPDRHKRELVQQLMNKVARVRLCLVNPEKKRAYDKRLAMRRGIQPPAGDEKAAEGAAAVRKAAPGRAARAEAPAVEPFEENVRRHLRRWRLNPHEELLLLAGAADLGIDTKAALKLIRRIDQEYEYLAVQKARRWNRLLVRLSIAVVVILLGTVGATVLLEVDRDQRFRLHLQAAVEHIAHARYRLARDEFNAARAIDPNHTAPDRELNKAVIEMLAAGRRYLQAAQAEPDPAKKDFRRSREILRGVKLLAPGNVEVDPLLSQAEAGYRQQMRRLQEQIFVSLRQSLANKQYRLAREQLEEILRMGPTDGREAKLVQQHQDALVEKVRQDLDDGKYVTALEAAANARLLVPGDDRCDRTIGEKAVALLARARQMIRLRQLEEAGRCVSDALFLRPGNPEAEELADLVETETRKAPEPEPATRREPGRRRR